LNDENHFAYLSTILQHFRPVTTELAIIYSLICNFC